MSHLTVVHQHVMPDTLNYKEEGGVSMHPDGSRFIAVRIGNLASLES